MKHVKIKVRNVFKKYAKVLWCFSPTRCFSTQFSFIGEAITKERFYRRGLFTVTHQVGTLISWSSITSEHPGLVLLTNKGEWYNAHLNNDRRASMNILVPCRKPILKSVHSSIWKWGSNSGYLLQSRFNIDASEMMMVMMISEWRPPPGHNALHVYKKWQGWFIYHAAYSTASTATNVQKES